jgi:hypothetical protein
MGHEVTHEEPYEKKLYKRYINHKLITSGQSGETHWDFYLLKGFAETNLMQKIVLPQVLSRIYRQ